MSTDIVTVTDESGAVAFYTIDKVFVETYEGIERVYALLLSIHKNHRDAHGGMVARYHPQRPDDQVLEPIESQQEMEHLMRQVHVYLDEKGLFMDGGASQ